MNGAVRTAFLSQPAVDHEWGVCQETIPAGLRMSPFAVKIRKINDLALSHSVVCKELKGPIFCGLPRFSQRFPQCFPHFLCKRMFTLSKDVWLGGRKVNNCRWFSGSKAPVDDAFEPFLQLAGE